jgi:spore maturation protein CgeB
MMKVLLFQHPKSRYGVLASMTQSLQKAFVRQGVEAVIYEWWKGDPDDLERVVKQENPDCTFSINIFVDETYFYMPFGIPHVYLSVDAFTYCHPALPVMPHLVTMFVDGCSKDLFAARSEHPVYFFPHAIAKESIQTYKAHSWKPFHERPYDVVLLGSYVDYSREKTLWEALFSQADVNALVARAERALEDTTYPFLADTLSFVENTPSIRLIIDEQKVLPGQLVNSVEQYVRGVDKERLLQSLNGRTVHIFSEESQWKNMAPNAVFHEPVSFDQVCQVCSQAKVVLNSVPTIRKGYHERLFLGLASGAIVVTSQLDLPAWLETSGALVSYRTSTLPTLQERLEQAEKFERTPNDIFMWLDNEHTWDVRVKTALPDIMNSVSAIHDAWDANPFWKLST